MKKTNKKLTFWDILYWTLAVVPFLISLSFYSRLPDQVPTHWGADNMVNGYSSRNMAAFGIPSFMFFMAVLVNVIHRIDPKRENIRRSKELKQITRWFVVVLSLLHLYGDIGPHTDHAPWPGGQSNGRQKGG